MKNIIFLAICILSFLFCPLLEKSAKGDIDWTNKTVDTLIFFNNTISSYLLKPKYKRLAVPFSVKEKGLLIKGETYDYPMNSINGRYYTVAEHRDKHGHDYKLIIYNIEGDNDTEILVTQINAYRLGVPVDALVLEMNFTFETKCSARYTVNDSVIKIDRHEINNILYAEDGAIIGTKAIPDTIVNHSIYKIRNGLFIKE